MEGLGSGLSPLSASHFSCFLSLGGDAGAESSCGFHVVVRTVKAAVCGLWPGCVAWIVDACWFFCFSSSPLAALICSAE